MNDPAPCDECQALHRELAEAYAEAWASSDERTRDAWDAVYKMIGGTEEDVERAGELLPTATFRDRPRVTLALQKAFMHKYQTGHAVPIRWTAYL
jgi:hypothetical protein